jgi:peptidoglycan/xylan/chitin deacetylase (PgdA/CDA1 family)
MTGRYLLCILALLLAGASAGTPSAVQGQAASTSESSPVAEVATFVPRPLILEAGRQVGYRFADDGSVLARRAIVLADRTQETATRRRTVAGRVHLLVGSGVLAGWYVRESIVAHLKGMAGSVTLGTPVSVQIPAGTVIAYRFDADWRLIDAVIRSVAVGHRRPADRVGVIDGRRYYHLTTGAWSGAWIPAVSDGRGDELRCTTGARAPIGTGEVVRRTENAGGRLALTFDMGGRLVPALRIMRYLLLHGVCTTIFPTGDSAETSIGSQVLAMVRRYPQVFEVGNHTMHHCNLVRGGEGPNCPASRPTSDRVRAELLNAAALISAATDQSPVPYWRPPYGAFDAAVLRAAASVSYTKTIMWDVDTIDWRPISQGGPTAADVAAKVVGNTSSGSVVLMHLGGFSTRDALPAMLHGLSRVRHLQPTTISQLLRLD